MKTIVAIFHTILITVGLGYLPHAQAVVPPPDGGYPGGNTAEGASALFSLTTGSYNTAVGFFSLRSNTSGSFNTATGAGALLLNSSNNPNTATGNTATGAVALLSNTIGFNNTATGFQALANNTTGDTNTAIGYQALLSNTTGFGNTASGVLALFNNTSGTFNTALGFEAGSSVTTANNVIAIGTTGANVSNSCYIGHIFGTFNTAQSAVVYIDPDGRLGTGPSARRFKKDIADMGAASEVLLSMRPVTFHFKTQDTEKAGPEISQFGLIAEEVAEVNPDLILRDKEGEIYSVRYDAVNAMLLNEFLKAHSTMEEQASQIEQQAATISHLKKEIETIIAHSKEQDLQIQRVSDQVRINRSDARVAATDQ
jgi:hypothetical protein